MAKLEWGEKRTCQSCGTSFYDLMRSPIVCLKCGSVVVVSETLLKQRRPAPMNIKTSAAMRYPVAAKESAFDRGSEPAAFEVVEENEEDEDKEEEEEEENGEDTDAA